jgi:hypothetical protein
VLAVAVHKQSTGPSCAALVCCFSEQLLTTAECLGDKASLALNAYLLSCCMLGVLHACFLSKLTRALH